MQITINEQFTQVLQCLSVKCDLQNQITILTLLITPLFISSMKIGVGESKF